MRARATPGRIHDLNKLGGDIRSRLAATAPQTFYRAASQAQLLGTKEEWFILRVVCLFYKM